MYLVSYACQQCSNTKILSIKKFHTRNTRQANFAEAVLSRRLISLVASLEQSCKCARAVDLLLDPQKARIFQYLAPVSQYWNPLQTARKLQQLPQDGKT